MGIGSDALAQLERLLRPHATRIANMVTRGVVQLVTDSGKLQLVQVGALAGETIDGRGGGGEHMQTYGFSSVPLVGAEAVVIFPGGDRSHPLVICAPDRRYRPSGGSPGDVVVYNSAGAKVTLSGANVIVQPGSGGAVLLGGSGAVDGAIKGTTRNTAEQTFLTALATFVAAITPSTGAPAPAIATMGTAISSFVTALGSTISTDVKVG